jgi:hypothetical protein
VREETREPVSKSSKSLSEESFDVAGRGKGRRQKELNKDPEVRRGRVFDNSQKDPRVRFPSLEGTYQPEFGMLLLAPWMVGEAEVGSQGGTASKSGMRACEIWKEAEIRSGKKANNPLKWSDPRRTNTGLESSG